MDSPSDSTYEIDPPMVDARSIPPVPPNTPVTPPNSVIVSTPPVMKRSRRGRQPIEQESPLLLKSYRVSFDTAPVSTKTMHSFVTSMSPGVSKMTVHCLEKTKDDSLDVKMLGLFYKGRKTKN